MIKYAAIIGVLATVIFLWARHGDAADPPVMDSRYIKEHFPEAYLQIFEEGRAAGKKEAGAGKSVPVQAAPAAPAPANSEISPVAARETRPELGAWWEKNSLKYSPVPGQWLFHIEGTLDYKHKTGNTESDLYNGSASLMARKLRFTNTLTYIIDKELTEQASQPGSPVSRTDNDYRSIQDFLRYDLTDRFYTEGGYLWEKDKANYISGRDSYYAGIGYTFVETPRHLLDVLVGGGYVKEAYPEAVKLAMNMEHETVNAGYFREKYQWRITDRITYKETFRIIQNFTSSRVFNDDLLNLQVTGRTDRYRWFLINEIYFKLVDHLDFMTGYKIEYDSNPWPTVEKFDTTIKSGIQFSF
ncbi:MAG: DUF481 domain-containing protein [Pseudomonadota bacterium]